MRDLIDKPFDNVADAEDLVSAYRLILGRNPERAGYEHNLTSIRNGMSVDKLFSEFINSDEYRARSRGKAATHQQPIPQSSLRTQLLARCGMLSARAMSALGHVLASSPQDAGKDNALLKNHLSVEEYNSLYNELVSSQPQSTMEYFRYHKRRYYELFNAMEYYLKDKAEPRVLDVGVSGFLPLYKKLFPEITLVTIDRPTDQNGFDSSYSINTCGARYHYNIDLNRESLSQSWGTPPIGAFDYIIFTEILEHLVINPVELLGDIISLLKPDGRLYLTTPNFFQYGYLQKIKSRENPQQVVPRRGQNYDAHHHFREYSMNELIDFIRDAGGEVVNHYFSDCWDDPSLIKTVLLLHPDQKSNLVVVSKRRGQTKIRGT